MYFKQNHYGNCNAVKVNNSKIFLYLLSYKNILFETIYIPDFTWQTLTDVFFLQIFIYFKPLFFAPVVSVFFDVIYIIFSSIVCKFRNEILLKIDFNPIHVLRILSINSHSASSVRP